MDIFEFLKYSYPEESTYSGIVYFEFETDLGMIPYTLKMKDKKLKVERNSPLEDDYVNCKVSISIDDFLHMYSGKATSSEIMNMCYSGRVKVHSFAYRQLTKFATSFDFSSEKWNRYYKHLECSNTVKEEVVAFTFPTLQTLQRTETMNWRFETTLQQSWLKASMNAAKVKSEDDQVYHVGRFVQRAFGQLLDTSTVNCKAKQIVDESLNQNMVLQPPTACLQKLNPVGSTLERKSYATTRRRHSLSELISGIVPVQMHMKPKSINNGYMSGKQLAYRELKIQGDALFDKITRKTQQPVCFRFYPIYFIMYMLDT